ncbi:RimJ/RimL family protein N-acetyltransferase [Actinoplanes octamycinicus]|uniref:RimJ/RimL family protein N-acetyltransferase n=1 Tax=Actinoplanes octamycinicus TaxID=135948 RepID=A0A7W7GT28_9ACTN|nr:GNAT family N-acetyltransferase [Actinoplanes octamycinicus]MBB4737722.1 RimJ/RimL family protein N-acetyltransferase [Actinoplanes octamycinicus]GIE58023.1 N-acetyltransferase [Actinoplanes octamycinicus]
MENWTVRRVTPRDAGRMRALRLEMLADSPLAFLETLAQAAARSHEGYAQRLGMSADGPELSQFIADPGDGPLLGHAGGTAIPDEPHVTVVFSVYLTPAVRGGKLLAQLVDAVADWSTAAGRHELMLEVVVGNGRAVRAYEKLGFQDTGVRLPHPTVPVLTQLQMRRRM